MGGKNRKQKRQQDAGLFHGGGGVAQVLDTGKGQTRLLIGAIDADRGGFCQSLVQFCLQCAAASVYRSDS